MAEEKDKLTLKERVTVLIALYALKVLHPYNSATKEIEEELRTLLK